MKACALRNLALLCIRKIRQNDKPILQTHPSRHLAAYARLHGYLTRRADVHPTAYRLASDGGW